MEWERPEALYLILPVLGAWLALALYARAKRRAAARAFVDAAMASRILPTDSSVRFWLKTSCTALALVCGLVALAGPRFGVYYEQVKARGSDLYIAIDVSRSMLADDVPPNRLERAKNDVSALLNRLNGERVGLIAFAGQAVVKCPLTSDYNFFRLALNELDPNSAPRGGTAIGDAIRKAMTVFPDDAERDRAIILITDGDDQNSFVSEAAAQAAEKRIIIFTVGLGDGVQGSRVPVVKDGKLTFAEENGQQVWSKLNHDLLKEIALKTKGVYIPAGTKAYDLGQLYGDHLSALKGGEGQQSQRARRHERYQVFLALALFFLLADLFIRPYRAAAQTVSLPAPNKPATALVLLLAMLAGGTALAGDANKALREGVTAYGKDDFEKAVEHFTTATEALKDDTSEKSALAAYDLACAYHRKGDTANARENYLKAAMSKDKKIAAESNYNLGVLAGETARTLAGEKPEEVPADKREEIVTKLKDAVASFRHTLDIQKDHLEARKNLELIRQWIKVYREKWEEADRAKRREELNLQQFLEFLINTEKALRETTRNLPENTRRNTYAELKRAQDFLIEEVPFLNLKLKKQFDEMAQAKQPQVQQPSLKDPKQDEQLQQALKLLQDWSEASGKYMTSASTDLQNRQQKPAAENQKRAIKELERIWDSLANFEALLAKALADQTRITTELKPDKLPEPANVPAPLAPPEKKTVATHADTAQEFIDLQEDTLRRTQLLPMKAQMELKEAEAAAAQAKQQPPAQPPQPPQPGQPAPQQGVDPQKMVEWFKKGIELAPKAAEKESAALGTMKARQYSAAYPDAEEARKILEEIMKAKPEDPNKKDDQNQDKKDDQQKKDQQNKDEQKKQDEKKDDKQENKNDEKKDEEKKKDEQKQAKPEELNKDQVEDILRKVREREKKKQERDKEIKARMYGPGNVDKDW